MIKLLLRAMVKLYLSNDPATSVTTTKSFNIGAAGKVIVKAPAEVFAKNALPLTAV